MKIKSLILGLCAIAVSTTTLAAGNRHSYPAEKTTTTMQASAQNAMAPGYCEIEIINDSYDDLTVYGQFDDGTLLTPFNIYRYETPHYISLYYYGYCHKSMMLTIDTFRGYRVYSGYAPVDHTIRIVPSALMKGEMKAVISKK